jgi:hypothetical protein
MKNLPWGRISGIAIQSIMAAVLGVQRVEALNNTAAPLSGQQKKAEVIDLIQSELAIAEGIAGHSLAHDGDVLQAAGGVIDAVTALHNVLAAKAPAPKS